MQNQNNEYKYGYHFDGSEEYASWEDYEEYEEPAPQVHKPAPQVPIKTQRVQENAERNLQQEEEEQKRREAREIEMVQSKLNWVNVTEQTHNMEPESSRDDEFPALDATFKQKNHKKHPDYRPNELGQGLPSGRMVKGKKLIVTGVSYGEERRRHYQHYQQENYQYEKTGEAERTKAFEVLADKDGLEKKLTKTRMCNSVGKGNCHHGVQCRFAHSLDDLKISTCFFGDRCRFIKVVQSKVVNSGRKNCEHKHPQESEDEFYTRTGLDRFKPKMDFKAGVEKEKVLGSGYAQKTNLFTPPKRIVLDIPSSAKPSVAKPSVAKPSVAKIVTKESNETAKLHTQQVALAAPTVTATSEPEETVLRVPRELAMQAMELLIASGNSRIRVEII